jgi:formylglycine-generating enzyme required for sulfatase activity
MGHIFISYSHKDMAYAKKLVLALEQEGFTPWVDERLDYGSQWPLELQEHLDTCEAFIVLMTPNSLASEWVQSELSRAKRKNKPIFPLLLAGDETWLSVESTQYMDVRGGVLPPEKFYQQLAGATPRRSGHLPVLETTPEPSAPEPSAPRAAGFSPSGVNQKQLLTLAASAGGVVLLLIVGLLGLPKLFSPPPTATFTTVPTLTVTLEPTQTITPTLSPTETPTLRPTLTATPFPAEIVDAQGVSMVFVPAGKFTMGSENGDLNEKPVHEVFLDSFYIDKFEVTNAHYRDCVLADGCQAPLQFTSYTRADYYDSSQFDDYPVVYVTWEMAKKYCEWRGARLPTEAEWEKAARGTDKRLYPWGAGIDASRANYKQNMGDTTAVGSYENGKSPYGAYDMTGNVWEWVADWFQENYYVTLGNNAVNPQGPKSGQEKVLRGGSFYYGDYVSRTSNRGWSGPTDLGAGFGIRCAASVQP